MQTASIREFTRHFSQYLKVVKEGGSVTILERHKPVAVLMPQEDNVRFPGWKRPIKLRKIKGEPLSKTVLKNR